MRRAVFWSASVSLVTALMLFTLFDLLAGRPPRLAAAVPVVALMAIVVAVVAAVIWWPAARLLRRYSPALSVAAAVLLAFVPLGLLIALLRDGDDPATVAGFLRFWWHVPGEFIGGFVPFLAASLVLSWRARRSERPGVSG